MAAPPGRTEMTSRRPRGARRKAPEGGRGGAARTLGGGGSAGKGTKVGHKSGCRGSSSTGTTQHHPGERRAEGAQGQHRPRPGRPHPLLEGRGLSNADSSAWTREGEALHACMAPQGGRLLEGSLPEAANTGLAQGLLPLWPWRGQKTNPKELQSNKKPGGHLQPLGPSKVQITLECSEAPATQSDHAVKYHI